MFPNPWSKLCTYCLCSIISKYSFKTIQQYMVKGDMFKKCHQVSMRQGFGGRYWSSVEDHLNMSAPNSDLQCFRCWCQSHMWLRVGVVCDEIRKYWNYHLILWLCGCCAGWTKKVLKLSPYPMTSCGCWLCWTKKVLKCSPSLCCAAHQTFVQFLNANPPALCEKNPVELKWTKSWLYHVSVGEFQRRLAAREVPGASNLKQKTQILSDNIYINNTFTGCLIS